MKRLEYIGFNGKPSARWEIRGKYVCFEIERKGEKFQRVRPRSEFGRGDYLD